MTIEQAIIEKLATLREQEFADIGRAGSMLWLCFGDEVVIRNYKGIDTVKNRYNIHAQCPWRFVQNGKIILASGDVFQPKVGAGYENFEWDKRGENRIDDMVGSFKQNFIGDRVKSISADMYGGLRLTFKSELEYELFPNNSLQEEFWRFIDFSSSSEHFVVFEA